MTSVPKSTVTERQGVFYTGYVLSLANLIFRETANTDVGADGQIELIDEEQRATGLLAGVQIKSGDSFVNLDTQTFTLRAEPKHFEYWEKFCLPTIGIVYSPTLRKAVWFDLKKYAAQINTEGGPFQISDTLNETNELSTERLPSSLVNLIKTYHGVPVTLEDVQKIAEVQEDKQAENLRLSKEIAWKRLTTIFLSSVSEPYVVADVGYRLSWYFPAVSDYQKEFFKERLTLVSDKSLVNIISAIHQTLEDNRPDVSEHICDLLSYLPNNVARLKQLAVSKMVPADQLEALFQTVEYLSQEINQKFRADILKLYGLNNS